MNPEGLVESVLFLSGKKVKKEFLDSLLKKHFGVADIENTIRNLNTRYQNLHSGLEIISTDNYVEMVTSKLYHNILKEIFPPQDDDTELTDALLETLTIIAYKQPIEKTEIDRIRGVSSSRAISTLLEKGFIKPVSNSNISDRISYITTDRFLDYFGIKSISELPDIEEIKSSLSK
ncbi:MAG: SMC-Scp complex subunit ScpB [Brevinematia bacterium]